MSREVMQQALEALELHAKQYPHMQKGYTVDAITALRAALAEPYCDDCGGTDPECPLKRTEPDESPITNVTEAVTTTIIEVEKLLCEKLGKAWQPSGMSIQTLVDELAAQRTEPEPVHQWRKSGCANWYDGHPDYEDGGGPYEARVLYTHPPQRTEEFVCSTGLCHYRRPLTDEEITQISIDTPINLYAFARAIEAAHGIKQEEA